MGKIVTIAASERRGTKKKPLEKALFHVGHGIVGDAHAGKWHRQVSFLGAAEIEAFRACGATVSHGDFGENIVAEGFSFRELPVGTRLASGDVIFEITQIGKECHAHCAIYAAVGDCIMPREGVFARVLHGGTLRPGDALSLFEGKLPFDAAVITASDKGARGEREDKSGDLAQHLLEEAGYRIARRVILPDDEEALA